MRNSVDDSFLVFTIHGEHKRALQFHNDTEKFGVLTATHPHKSTEKLSKLCTHLTGTPYVFREAHRSL